MLYYLALLVRRLGTLIYIPMIVCGLLRTLLFGVNLRIRWTIKQSAVAVQLISVDFVRVNTRFDRLILKLL